MRGFKVKSKKKKKKWAGPLRPIGKPVKPAGKPVARELLNLDLNSNRSNRPVKPADKPVKPAGKPIGTGCTGAFEFI